MATMTNRVVRRLASAASSRPLRRGRAILAAALALTFGFQEFAWAACTLANYPTQLPVTGFSAGNFAGQGTFTAPKGAIFIPDRSTLEDGVPTHGGHWWVSDQGFGLCRMSLGPTGRWVVPPGRPANLCTRIVDVLGQPDYDPLRQLVYVPGLKTSVWRLQLAERPDGSGKDIVGSAEVRPTLQGLPENSGFDAVAVGAVGTFLYAASHSNASVWGCVNPSSPAFATTRCKPIAHGVENGNVTSLSYNPVTHSLWLAEPNNVSEVDHVDTCFVQLKNCRAHATTIGTAALLPHPTALQSFGRFLYVGDDFGRVAQANVQAFNVVANPNGGRVVPVYASGTGGVVTGFGVDPTDGLQVFADPLVPGAQGLGLVTRLPLCPSTP